MNAAKNQRLGKKACIVGKKFKSFLKILLNLAPMHYFSIINPLYSERGWRSLHKQTSGGGGKIQNRMIAWSYSLFEKKYNTLLLSDNGTNTKKQKIIFSRSNLFIIYLDHVVVITSPDS